MFVNAQITLNVFQIYIFQEKKDKNHGTRKRSQQLILYRKGISLKLKSIENNDIFLIRVKLYV